MAGARPRTYRLGDRSELLVEQLLSAFAFTTRVPRQEDIGIDFFCSLISGTGKENLLKAGPFFTVQAKSSAGPVAYEKDYEIAWIASQENPLFLCVADRPALAMDVYSTWNVPCGPLFKKASRITLLPGANGSGWPGVEYKEDGSQEVCLGPPIVRVADSDIFDESRVEQIVKVISEWVKLDRINIVNRQAGIYWVVGPVNYQTGQPPYASRDVGFGLYTNPNNRDDLTINLGRVVTALTRVLRDSLPDAARNQPAWAARTTALQEVLRSHWDLFDQGVQRVLIQEKLLVT